MCHPAAPIEMKRRSMLVHSVRRVPPATASSFHRISKPPQLYSSILGASARVTVVSVTCGVGAPTVVSFTLVPTVPRLPSASKGAHARRCAGSVSACQTFSGEWRRSLTRTSVHFSPFFCTCAPLAGPGVYCARLLIFFSFSSFSLVLIYPCGRGGVREHPRTRTITSATEQANVLPSAQRPLPALQLRDLNKIAAGIVQHGDLGGRYVRWWRGELGAARFHTLVIGLHVVGEEHGRGLALLEHGLLVGAGRRLIFSASCNSVPSGSSGE